jgi:hypothetical protein
MSVSKLARAHLKVMPIVYMAYSFQRWLYCPLISMPSLLGVGKKTIKGVFSIEQR